MSDNLYQMTAQYEPTQDRILFRVSTEKRFEYRIWLTRRMVKELWEVAVKAFEAEPEVKQQAHQPRVQQAVMSMKHQKALQAADFSKKHDTKTIPPPEADKTLLAISTEIRITATGTVKLTLHTAERKNVNLNFGKEMLHGICHILQHAADRANWDLQLNVGDLESLVTQNVAKVH